MPLSLSLDQRKALVRHYIKTIWNAQEVESTNYASEQQQETHPSYTDEVNFFASPPCVYLGAERLPIPLEQISQVVHKTFPDMHFVIIDILGEGEKIVVRWLLRGTDLGGYKDHLPTGKSIRMTGITIFRLEQHTIVEEWIEADIAGMLSQLGFVSTPQPPRITVRRPGNVFPA
jgi:SnoaL-like polyketide cyclase